jgi:flagella basal body P-ring formation protein FlgA
MEFIIMRKNIAVLIDAGSEVLRRAGVLMRPTRPFGVPQDRRSAPRMIAKIGAAIIAAAALCFVSLTMAAEPDSTNDALASIATAPIPEAGMEKFVPNIAPISCSGTLEMLKAAEIPGAEIRVRQVVRWSEADSASFSSIADLVIDRFDGSADNRKLSLEELRSTLIGAGVNLGLVRFSGANTCLLSHADVLAPAVPTDDRTVIQQWIDQKNKAAAEAAPSTQPSDLAVNGSDVGDPESSPYHTLRDLLIIDLAQRLNLPVDQLQLNFDPTDRNMLNLSEPAFRFDLQPRRVRDLGRVSWDVTVVTGTKEHTVSISADARAWQRQLVVEKAANYKQIIRDSDISERRVLVDHLSDDQLLTRDQIVGQQAARDVKPGTVLTAKLVDPVPLARNGQYVTVTLNEGGLQVRTVAKAMESGSFGQTIKVKSEQTQEVYDVTLTGPQQGTMGP